MANMDFLTQVKEKHHFSSAVDENSKRSQTLILKFQSAAEMKGPITASVAPPSPLERLSLFELPQKKKWGSISSKDDRPICWMPLSSHAS